MYSQMGDNYICDIYIWRKLNRRKLKLRAFTYTPEIDVLPDGTGDGVVVGAGVVVVAVVVVSAGSIVVVVSPPDVGGDTPDPSL